MIEDQLANYGILGLWTLSLLYERFISMTKSNQIIQKNTDAINKLIVVVEKNK